MKKRKSDGLYVATVDTGQRNKNGSKKYKYFYGKTQKEVNKKIDDYKMDISTHGKPLDSKNITFNSWFDICYTTFFVNELAKSSYCVNFILFEKHIKDSFIGDMLLRDITPVDLQNFINSLEKSTSTLKLIKNIFSKTFKLAIKNNYIRINPVTDIIIPKKKKREVTALTTDEQVAYFNALEGEKYELFFKLLLSTGIRIGEGLALKWDDIDFDRNLISINKAYSETYSIINGEKERIRYVSTTKTVKSNRTVPLPSFLKTMILNKLKDEEIKDTNNYIFIDTNENIFQQDTIRAANRRICKKANIKVVSVHSLRHTFATRMLENDMNIKLISELLGHSDIGITLDIYSHVTPQLKDNAKTTIDAFFENL